MSPTRGNSGGLSQGRSLAGPIQLTLLSVVLTATAGCHQYSYHVRAPNQDLQLVASEVNPHSEIRWSKWWSVPGGVQWSPTECVEPLSGGPCKQVALCD